MHPFIFFLLEKILTDPKLLKDSILMRKTSNKILLTVVYININILNCEFPWVSKVIIHIFGRKSILMCFQWKKKKICTWRRERGAAIHHSGLLMNAFHCWYGLNFNHGLMAKIDMTRTLRVHLILCLCFRTLMSVVMERPSTGQGFKTSKHPETDRTHIKSVLYLSMRSAGYHTHLLHAWGFNACNFFLHFLF